MEDQIAKELFEKYSKDCAFMSVSCKGKIFASTQLKVSFVAVDKDGNIVIMWYDDDWTLRQAFLNQVKSADACNSISGVFNSKDIASATAKEHYMRLKQERISELEAEIERLKSEE